MKIGWEGTVDDGDSLFACHIEVRPGVGFSECPVGGIGVASSPFLLSFLAFSQCAGFAALKYAGMYYRSYRKKEAMRW